MFLDCCSVTITMQCTGVYRSVQCTSMYCSVVKCSAVQCSLGYYSGASVVYCCTVNCAEVYCSVWSVLQRAVLYCTTSRQCSVCVCVFCTLLFAGRGEICQQVLPLFVSSKEPLRLRRNTVSGMRVAYRPIVGAAVACSVLAASAWRDSMGACLTPPSPPCHPSILPPCTYYLYTMFSFDPWSLIGQKGCPPQRTTRSTRGRRGGWRPKPLLGEWWDRARRSSSW